MALARFSSHFIMFNPDLARSAQYSPDTLAPVVISMGYRAVCLKRETGVNILNLLLFYPGEIHLWVKALKLF